MAQEIGADRAKEVGDIHEVCEENPASGESTELVSNGHLQVDVNARR